MEKPVYLFSDGACSGNPGPGGYGVLLRFGTNELNLSRGFRLTTNNRMELMAVIDGLKALTKAKNGLEVIIVTDSKYVVDAVEKKWVFTWAKTNFKGKKNPDLWKEFLALYPKFNIKFKWIKGHNGHKENEACDKLAVAASMKGNHIDEGYEILQEEENSSGLF